MFAFGRIAYAPAVERGIAAHLIHSSQCGCLCGIRTARTVGGEILGRANSWGNNLLYGFAHLGKSLFWYSSELLFAYFLTEFVRLPSQQMGIVLAAGFLVAALIDVATGTGFQRTLADSRSASRLQFLGSILCSLSLMLVFAGAWLPMDLRFAYSMAAGLIFRLCYALYDVPQNALMALATAGTASRLRLASTRIWFSGIATLVVAMAVGPLVEAQSSAARPDFLFSLSAAFAATAIVSAWLLRRPLRNLSRPAARTAAPPDRMRRMPRDFWLLLFVMFATSLFTPLFSKLEPYFATYVLRSPWWGGIVVIAMAGGIIAGQPLWMRMCAHAAHGRTMVGTALIQIVGLGAFATAGSGHPLLAVGAAFVFGLGNGGVGMVQWAAFSETVARLGSGWAGASYGLFSATAKLAQAAGGVLLDMTLAGIDLDAGAGVLGPVMAALAGSGALCAAATGIALHLDRRRPRAETGTG